MCIAAAIALTGCEEEQVASVVVDSIGQIVVDIALGRYPEITADEAPVGQVSSPYRWKIGAEVKRSPFDEAYNYSFDLVNGRLPEGLVFRNEGDHAIIEGTPSELGEFPITIRVTVEELRLDEVRPDNTVLSSTDEKDFTVHVDE
jgi:hypothetical protein